MAKGGSAEGEGRERILMAEEEQSFIYIFIIYI
jgi:hypothetical protein